MDKENVMGEKTEVEEKERREKISRVGSSQNENQMVLPVSEQRS